MGKIGAVVVLLFTLLAPRVALSEDVENTPTEAPAATSESGFVSYLKSSAFGTLSTGALWQDGGKSQDATLAPGIDRTYAATSSTLALFNGELFVGIREPLLDNLLGQFGLVFATSGGARLAGDIWDDNDPAFDNFAYQYKVSHTYLGLKSKALLDVGAVVTPWISASLGLGFNSAYDFANQAKTDGAVPAPAFADNTTTSFSYTLGIGVQYELSKNWQLGLGYEFSNWGKSALGAAPGQTTGTGLSLPHLYTSGILLSLTFSS